MTEFLTLKIYSNNFIFCDSMTNWQIGMQDPATPMMEGIINFHNHIMLFIIGIGIFVFWLLARCVILFSHNNNKIVDNFTHCTSLEIIWTILPAIILMTIAIPSFGLLYSIEELLDPSITIKVIGHQWYWNYEYSDYNYLTETGEDLTFDSYMLPTDSLKTGYHRLLEVDNRLVLPYNVHIRVLITAADVLHSWAVPAFGIKSDACPGRLNQVGLFIKRPGIFYGQCSEICGTNHGFMPICVESVTNKDYLLWLKTKLEIKE